MITNTHEKRKTPVLLKQLKDYSFEKDNLSSIESFENTIVSTEDDNLVLKAVLTGQDLFEYQQKLIEYQKFHLKRIRMLKSKNSMRKSIEKLNPPESAESIKTVIQPITTETILSSLAFNNLQIIFNNL